MWQPAIFAEDHVYTGVHHGDAYGKMPLSAKSSDYLSGKYDDNLQLFLADEGQIIKILKENIH